MTYTAADNLTSHLIRSVRPARTVTVITIKNQQQKQVVPRSGVEWVYSIWYAQQSVRFPQDNLCHFVLECEISPKYSGTQIIAKDSQSKLFTSEDTEYNLSVY